MYMKELERVHPITETWLILNGYEYKHHYRLQSGKVIDYLATKGSIVLIVECKPHANDLNKAIKQVIGYTNELGYGLPLVAIPTILRRSRDVYKKRCADLGVMLLEVMCPPDGYALDEITVFRNRPKYQGMNTDL